MNAKRCQQECDFARLVFFQPVVQLEQGFQRLVPDGVQRFNQRIWNRQRVSSDIFDEEWDRLRRLQKAEHIQQLFIQMNWSILRFFQAKTDQIGDGFGRSVGKRMQEAMIEADPALRCLLQQFVSGMLVKSRGRYQTISISQSPSRDYGASVKFILTTVTTSTATPFNIVGSYFHCATASVEARIRSL